MKISRKVIFKKYPITIKMSEEEYMILTRIASWNVSVPDIVGSGVGDREDIQLFLNKINDFNFKE